VYTLVVLYALCYQLQRPIEPFLVDTLVQGADGDVSENESAKAFARLSSVFAVAQSFGSLGFGFILDRWGVRTGLAINFAACAMSYHILSITDTIELLYLSKVSDPCGELLRSVLSRIFLILTTIPQTYECASYSLVTSGQHPKFVG
jgi:MFS family permease